MLVLISLDLQLIQSTVSTYSLESYAPPQIGDVPEYIIAFICCGWDAIPVFEFVIYSLVW